MAPDGIHPALEVTPNLVSWQKNIASNNSLQSSEL